MPLMLDVLNATFERHKIMINSRVFLFEPRSVGHIPEEYADFLMADHATKGVIVMRHGDDLKQKEREALINYLNFLNTRIYNYQLYLDEKKRGGVTVEEPADFKRYKRWKEEITKKLNVEAPVVEEKSFLSDAKPLFAGEMKVEEVSLSKKDAASAKRAASVSKGSFSSADIIDEVIL